MFDYDLHDWHRRLIAVRNNWTALQLGEFTTLLADDDTGVYAFERSHGAERVVVALNNSPDERRVTLLLDGEWTNLLEETHQTADDGLIVILQPLDGMIFGRNDARSTVGGK